MKRRAAIEALHEESERRREAENLLVEAQQHLVESVLRENALAERVLELEARLREMGARS